MKKPTNPICFAGNVGFIVQKKFPPYARRIAVRTMYEDEAERRTTLVTSHRLHHRHRIRYDPNYRRIHLGPN